MSGPQMRPSGYDDSDVQARKLGKDFLIALYAAVRSLRLYPLENEQVQRALRELVEAGNNFVALEEECEVRVAGEFVFVNGSRIRHDFDNFSYFREILRAFKRSGVGTLKVVAGVGSNDWHTLANGFSIASQKEDADDAFQLLEDMFARADCKTIEVEPPADYDEEADSDAESKEVAKRTYERSVAATKQLIGSVRMGRSGTVKQVKRAVQGIVDQVLGNETSLVGLTAIRDYDEYTFQHSVNVCIFSVSIGRRLGLTKLQLYDLGMAALLHDLGKSRVSHEVTNKEGPLTDDEWKAMQSHPWLGALTLFNLRGYSELPYRAIIAAYEHHMKTDLTGYPRSMRPREMSLFSKIVAVADGFDAATSRRSYQTTPLQPDEVLQEMWHNPKRGMDPVLVKGMINLLGVYPVGTCVLLDTYEVGVVYSVNPNPKCLNQPLVKVIIGAGGQPKDPPEVVDLSEQTGPDSFVRSILKVVDPEKYHINPGDCFK